MPINLKHLLCLFCGCLLSLNLLGCQPEQSVPEVRPLLTINDQTISSQEFIQAFNQTLHPDQQLSSIERQELQRAFLIQLIDRELIHSEARRRLILITPQEIEQALIGYRQDYPEGGFEAMLAERGMTLNQWKRELEESLTMEKLLEQTVYPALEISDEEISDYYQANREQFNRPKQVRVRQILVADDAEGRRLQGLLRQGEGFAEVAREHSLSPDAQQGGDLGFFSRGEMPAAFDEVVFDLPVGRLSDLVQSDYGYHLFLVEERRAAAQLGKLEAAAEIRATLEEQKREMLYLDWLQALRSQATIQVDWDQLEPETQN